MYLFVSLLVLLHGIPIPAQQSGTVSGILRDAAGKPVAGVRVAAVAVPQSPAEAKTGTVMGAIAETDTEGRYRLESIPPGRYYIAAGRLDVPTYYPGTQEMSKGTIVSVAAGGTYSQIDFSFSESSRRREPSSLPFTVSTYVASPIMFLPIDLRVDEDESIPLFGPAGFVAIRFEPTAGGPAVRFDLDTWLVRVPGPGPVGYRVEIENLPKGYAVKSMTYDAAELQGGVLRIPDTNFNSSTIVSIGWPGVSPQLPVMTLSAANPRPGANVPRTGPPLVITLVRSSVPTGTRVRGKFFGPPMRSIYLSGRPGILFSDGTFEFREVPPGRHSIVSPDGGSPLAASVVVGDSDLEGVRLETVAVLPDGIGTPAAPTPAGTHAPGTRVPLSSIRGKVLDRESREPPIRGMAYLKGEASSSAFSVSTDGSFEFAHLLPGSYTVEITTPEHEAVTRAVVVVDGGIDVEIEAVRSK